MVEGARSGVGLEFYKLGFSSIIEQIHQPVIFYQTKNYRLTKLYYNVNFSRNNKFRGTI